MKTPLLLTIIIGIALTADGQPAIDLRSVPVVYYYVKIQEPSYVKNHRDSVPGVELYFYSEWLSHLFNDATEGRIKVYGWLEDKKPLTKEEVHDILFKTDTILQTDPIFFDERLMIYTNETTYEQVTHIKFCERWLYDSNGRITKKIIGFAPVIEIVDRGYKSLFWIRQE